MASLSKGGPGRPGPDDELTAARVAVLDALALVPGSLRAPALVTPAPLRLLPATVETKIANRAAVGLAPIGPDHPRGRVWQRIVLPSGLFAGLDALGAAVAGIADRPVLAIAAGVIFVPFAALAGLGARFAIADPLRLSADELRAVNDAQHWESKQVWTGAASAGRERALVVVAAQLVGRIAGNPAWRTGYLDEHRVRLDLAAELDDVDAQAFRIAGAGGGTAVGAQPWDVLVRRVAGLVGYADALDAFTARAATDRAARAEATSPALMAGTAADEFATQELDTLRYFLRAATTEGPSDRE